MWNTNVSVDGGNEIANYRLSYTNLDQSGVLPNSEINKNTVSFAAAQDTFLLYHCIKGELYQSTPNSRLYTKFG